MGKRQSLTQAETGRVAMALRRILQSQVVYLDHPPVRGQAVQVRVAGTTIGTVDRNEDGDFVVTIPVMKDDVAPA